MYESKVIWVHIYELQPLPRKQAGSGKYEVNKQVKELVRHSILMMDETSGQPSPWHFNWLI